MKKSILFFVTIFTILEAIAQQQTPNEPAKKSSVNKGWADIGFAMYDSDNEFLKVRNDFNTTTLGLALNLYFYLSATYGKLYVNESVVAASKGKVMQ